MPIEETPPLQLVVEVATKCTGEVEPPLTGDETDTPANAGRADSRAHQRIIFTINSLQRGICKTAEVDRKNLGLHLLTIKIVSTRGRNSVLVYEGAEIADYPGGGVHYGQLNDFYDVFSRG